MDKPMFSREVPVEYRGWQYRILPLILWRDADGDLILWINYIPCLLTIAGLIIYTLV